MALFALNIMTTSAADAEIRVTRLESSDSAVEGSSPTAEMILEILRYLGSKENPAKWQDLSVKDVQIWEPVLFPFPDENRTYLIRFRDTGGYVLLWRNGDGYMELREKKVRGRSFRVKVPHGDFAIIGRFKRGSDFSAIKNSETAEVAHLRVTGNKKIVHYRYDEKNRTYVAE